MIYLIIDIEVLVVKKLVGPLTWETWTPSLEKALFLSVKTTHRDGVQGSSFKLDNISRVCKFIYNHPSLTCYIRPFPFQSHNLSVFNFYYTTSNQSVLLSSYLTNTTHLHYLWNLFTSHPISFYNVQVRNCFHRHRLGRSICRCSIEHHPSSNRCLFRFDPLDGLPGYRDLWS